MASHVLRQTVETGTRRFAELGRKCGCPGSQRKQEPDSHRNILLHTGQTGVVGVINSQHLCVAVQSCKKWRSHIPVNEEPIELADQTDHEDQPANIANGDR